jgi:hypothetical protein
MRDTTTYGKLSPLDLKDELVEVCAALTAAYTELGPLYADKNRTWIEAYARSPGNSVAAKEREGDYSCLEIGNDLKVAELRVESLKVKQDLLKLLIYHYG